MPDKPVWWRYRNDRDALTGIVMCHMREMRNHPDDTDWYFYDIGEITARIRRLEEGDILP